MSYELIISEKPQAAQKIAESLSDTKVAKVKEGGVNHFTLKHDGKAIVVASAVGHLYGLGEKGGESWKYPVYETEWKATYKTSKAAAYTKDYLNQIIKLGKNATEVTVASDFDIEGEVIGLNIVRHALKREDANRMKFSTLTKDELRKSYKNKQKHLEWGQAKAGETRHHLDWFYGINLSRAFTESIKKGANQFKVLSTGRVQAPALHFLAQREKKISAFKPEDFTEIYLDGECKKTSIKAQYELPLEIAKEHQITQEDDEGEEKKVIDRYKIFDKEFSKKVIEETTSKDGIIKDVTAKQFKQAAPIPFDLTSLQMEASTMLGYSPKRTLEIAQTLYVAGVTSYPRTSSQKLPKEIDIKSILEKLKKQQLYKEKVEKVFLVNPSIKPKEGKKTDPAHPAIHPTGEIPKDLKDQERKLYDLIVKRFFAIFGKDAIRETNTITIDINKHNFILKGTRTVEKNWHELYEPYLKFEDVQLPKLEKGQGVTNKGIEELEKKTSPPKRYTDASIIKELEKRNLGTKATRAQILEQLKDRGYIVDKSIKVTELGVKMDETISEVAPDLVEEALTREFEEEMELIREDKSTPEKVLERARKILEKILGNIRKNEIELGKKLAGASYEARKELEKLGKCNKCEPGDIVIRRSKATKKRFAGCNNYPNCKNIYPLPQLGKIEKTDQVDPVTKAPIIVLLKEGKRPWRLCVDPESPMNKREEKSEKKSEN